MDNRQALFTYALTLTHRREAAEDVVQTVFHRLLQGGRLPKELRPYVFRAVRNAAVDLLRRERRAGERESLFAPLNGSTDPDAIARREELALLLERVGDNERECIVLKVYNGMTFQEIGAVLGVPVGTAASWYRRGLEKMRRLLEGENS